MSNLVEAVADEAAARRRSLLLPALGATLFSGVMLGVYGLMVLVGELFVHSTIDDLPGDITYISPSGSERLTTAFEVLWPIVVGPALLFFVWRCRGRGQVLATWLSGIAAVLVSVVAFL